MTSNFRQATLELMRKQLRTRVRGEGSYAPGQLPRCWESAVRDMGIETVFDVLKYAGRVHLSEEPFACISMEDLKGDRFDPHINCDVNKNVLAKQEREFERRVKQEGVWGAVARVNPGYEMHSWEDVDSVWGFVGDDFWGSGYEHDLMWAAIDAFARHVGAPLWHDCHPDPKQRPFVFLTTLALIGVDLPGKWQEKAAWTTCTG